MKALIIGDIHGCSREFNQLLDQAAPSSDTEIICVGDLIDRGPDPRGILHFFSTHPRANFVPGNHEYNHLQFREGVRTSSPTISITRRILGTRHYDQFLSMIAFKRLFIETEEAIICHAFFDPSLPLELQPPEVLWGSNDEEERLNRSSPWHKTCRAPKPLIVGHRQYGKNGFPYIDEGRLYALDGKVHESGVLSAISLPDFRIYSVRGKSNQWTQIQARESRGKLRPSPPNEDLLEKVSLAVEQMPPSSTPEEKPPGPVHEQLEFPETTETVPIPDHSSPDEPNAPKKAPLSKDLAEDLSEGDQEDDQRKTGIVTRFVRGMSSLLQSKD